MQEKPRVSAQSTESRIDLGKSKRLAAMRESVDIKIEKEFSQPKQKPGGSKKERQIKQARDAIAQRIGTIKATYPQGMQNKLFALRYGSEEKINQMSLKKIFKLLKISQEPAKEIAGVKYENA